MAANTNETMPGTDATRGSDTSCPLCGGPNECGMAAGKGTCWCFSAAVPAEVVERVPAEQRGVVCVCAKCAAAAPTA